MWGGKVPYSLARTQGVASIMDKRGRIRLSTMEIALLISLVGMLVLGLLQARTEERLRRAAEARDEH